MDIIPFQNAEDQSVVLSFRASFDQAKYLELCAAKAGLTRASFIKLQLFSKEQLEFIDVSVLHELIAELRKVEVTLSFYSDALYAVHASITDGTQCEEKLAETIIMLDRGIEELFRTQKKATRILDTIYRRVEGT